MRGGDLDGGSGNNPLERRQFRRVLFDAIAELITPRAVHASRIVDLSLKGVLLHRPADWRPQPDEGVLVDIDLGDGGPHIRLHAAVAHIEPEHVGLHARHVDIESAARLRRLVELNLGDAALLERELSALA
jgi:hypothetical protein